MTQTLDRRRSQLASILAGERPASHAAQLALDEQPGEWRVVWQHGDERDPITTIRPGDRVSFPDEQLIATEVDADRPGTRHADAILYGDAVEGGSARWRYAIKARLIERRG
jgi:hypothetical protein